MTELRCDNKLHGILVEPHLIEVKCTSRYCGAPEAIVIHQFNLDTGEVVTKKYKNPRRK